MNNRMRAERLFRAERELKAARKRVARLVDRVATLAEDLEGPGLGAPAAAAVAEEHRKPFPNAA